MTEARKFNRHWFHSTNPIFGLKQSWNEYLSGSTIAVNPADGSKFTAHVVEQRGWRIVARDVITKDYVIVDQRTDYVVLIANPPRRQPVDADGAAFIVSIGATLAVYQHVVGATWQVRIYTHYGHADGRSLLCTYNAHAYHVENLLRSYLRAADETRRGQRRTLNGWAREEDVYVYGARPNSAVNNQEVI